MDKLNIKNVISSVLVFFGVLSCLYFLITNYTDLVNKFISITGMWYIGSMIGNGIYKMFPWVK